MTKTVEDLKAFVATFREERKPHEFEGEVIGEHVSMRTPDDYWYDPQPPFRDFNREIAAPGSEEAGDYPQGCLGIRADDDFWTVAVLPLEYISLTCEEIVNVLWPDMEDKVIKPDSGAPWWEERRREWDERMAPYLEKYRKSSDAGDQ